jgi:phage FluMu gp28-like protein
MPFADQLDILLAKGRDRRVQHVCIDSTGIGAMLAEEAQRKGGAKFEGVNFNVATKGEMYALMRRKFEERSVRVPVDRELREDLHAVQRLVSTGGNITYSAPRNADGHSDRAAALALCCKAANVQGGYCSAPGIDQLEDLETRWAGGGASIHPYAHGYPGRLS